MKAHGLLGRLVLAVFLSCMTLIAEAQGNNRESQCCSVVTAALQAVGQIKKGRKRADVEKEFSEQGGLSGRNETIYVYKLCPLIKVRVFFSPSTDQKGSRKSRLDDMVRSVSTPYIEYPVKD